MIEFSKEILTHFNCTICKKWWSVGDWQPEQNMCCPHCGIIHYEFREVASSTLEQTVTHNAELTGER